MFLVFIPRTRIIYLDQWVEPYYKPIKDSHNQNKNFNPKLPYQKPVPPTLLKHSPSFLSLPKLKASSLYLPKHRDLSLPNHVLPTPTPTPLPACHPMKKPRITETETRLLYASTTPSSSEPIESRVAQEGPCTEWSTSRWVEPSPSRSYTRTTRTWCAARSAPKSRSSTTWTTQTWSNATTCSTTTVKSKSCWSTWIGARWKVCTSRTSASSPI